MLSFTAIGAAIENAVVAASAEGLRADVDLLADGVSATPVSANIPVARIQFHDGAIGDPLAEFVLSRTTARRMERRPVEKESLRKLETSCQEFSDVRVHWVDKSQWDEFSELVGVGNRMRFEHEPFHREFYDNLRFSGADARRTGDGLDVATLQLPSGVASVLRALRSWRRMKRANVFGFSRGVARQAAREVCCSGAIGFLTVKSPEVPQFVDGGRAFERIWLTAASLGLHVHPTASLPVFLAHARSGGDQLLPHHKRRAAAMLTSFQRLFPELNGRAVQMAFRLGYGAVPQVRSLRRSLQCVVTAEAERNESCS